MQYSFLSAILASAAITSACVLPTDTLSSNITDYFDILIQNPEFPVIHDRYFSLLVAGGGDKHLFLAPVGDIPHNLVLVNGVIVQGIIHALIGGEYSDVDNTTKLFMTERNELKAIFQPVYGCNPDTDEVQVELAFQYWEQAPLGGNICVRIASGNRGYEFRYSPPDNPAYDPTNPCMAVTMAVVPPVSVVTTSTDSSPSTTATPTGTTIVDSTTTTAITTSTSISTSLPYTDETAQGWAFLGCSPEERRASDGPGRTLGAALLGDDAMTNQECIAFCGSSGYAYAGTEWTRECWCGNTVAPGRVPDTTLASLAGCNFPCGGDATQYCGGDAWLSLYQACPAGGPCDNVIFT